MWGELSGVSRPIMRLLCSRCGSDRSQWLPKGDIAQAGMTVPDMVRIKEKLRGARLLWEGHKLLWKLTLTSLKKKKKSTYVYWLAYNLYSPHSGSWHESINMSMLCVYYIFQTPVIITLGCFHVRHVCFIPKQGIIAPTSALSGWSAFTLVTSLCPSMLMYVHSPIQ